MIIFTTHEYDGEWVLRVQHDNGYMGLGVANGEQEAKLIARSLNLACADWEAYLHNNDKLIKAWEKYVR